MVGKKNLEMYFNPEVAASFAEREQNEKNFRVAEIVDKLVLHEIAHCSGKLYVAELGGGAHLDRYHKLFEKLLKEPNGIIDWVEISPEMIKLARNYVNTEEYRERNSVIRFVQNDILKYLNGLGNSKLDLAIMKYTLDHINNIDRLFSLLSKKLKKDCSLVATITNLSPELRSITTNARFLYKGKEFPENETRLMKDGDNFTIKFFKESGKPSAGYLHGAETLKYYHSTEKIKQLAAKYKFNIFLGDWKNYLSKKEQGKEDMNQDILILKRGR